MLNKSILLLLIIGLYPINAQQKQYVRDEFTYNAIMLEIEWDVFIRKLMGCPLDMPVSYKDDCDPSRGVVDNTAYEKARNKAKILFKLKDDKDHKSIGQQYYEECARPGIHSLSGCEIKDQ